MLVGEARLEDEDGRVLVLVDEAFGLLAAVDDLDADAGRLRQIAPHHLRPRFAGIEAGAAIKVHQGDAQTVIRLLPEAFADEQSEDEDEQQRQHEEHDERHRIAQHETQFFLHQCPDDAHVESPIC